MIDKSLEFLSNVLDQYLHAIHGHDLKENIVCLNHLTNADGSFPRENQNKIVITLINIDCESNKQFKDEIKLLSNQATQINPAVNFNVDILVSASFDDYTVSLKLLTLCVIFFQERYTFNQDNSTEFPSGISELKIEIENSTSANTQNIWTALGAKYVPSIIYKLKLVNIH